MLFCAYQRKLSQGKIDLYSSHMPCFIHGKKIRLFSQYKELYQFTFRIQEVFNTQPFPYLSLFVAIKILPESFTGDFFDWSNATAAPHFRLTIAASH